MTPTVGATTRQRILSAATERFATQGYVSTSVAQLQEDAGLAPGSGALYKHFRSKSALLEAVFDDYLQRLAAETDDVLASTPMDPAVALPRIAAAVRHSMRRDRNAIRMMLRDLDDRPDISERTWSVILTAVPARFAIWVARAREAGTIRADASDDDAVMLMAALMESSTLDALVARNFDSLLSTPFDDAWVRVALRALT